MTYSGNDIKFGRVGTWELGGGYEEMVVDEE